MTAGSFSACRWAGCEALSMRGEKLCGKHFNLRAGNSHGNGNRPKHLTAAERAAIRLRMSRLETPKSIAKDYGITVSTVRNACKGAA